MILATTSFVLGWMILILANPITSSMSKYYEKTKSNYSKDIDHLVTFNRNGLWIKENIEDGHRIIYAKKPNGFFLVDVTIFHLNKQSNLIEKIVATQANIKKNVWALENVILLKNENGMFK